jgi:vacuolar iron transporter family protein
VARSVARRGAARRGPATQDSPVAHQKSQPLKTSAWLRAAVLGANDGIVSTASLVLGVAAAHGAHTGILTAGVAGLVSGTMSMAAGEYVSVHSQADTERAALVQERAQLDADIHAEHRELAAIYVRRGVDKALARKVAEQLMAHDALGAHAHDELGSRRLIAHGRCRPRRPPRPALSQERPCHC